MEGLKHDFRETKEIVEEYIRTELDLIKVELVERLSNDLAALLSRLMLFSLLLVPILFGFLALGFYFGELFGSSAKGFGLVAGCVIVLYVVGVVGRKFLIKNPLQDYLIKKLAQTIFESDADKEGNKD